MWAEHWSDPMIVAGTHDPYLVALSILVASFASYTALDLGSRLGAAQGLARRVWLVAAAITMGGGIWAMHFVAMLAFVMPIHMSYDIGLTALSLIMAIAVTGIGFHVISRHSESPLRLMLSGVFMGLGIVSMHYTGMAAMRGHVDIAYDPLYVVLSVLIAIVASTAALWLAFRTTNLRQKLIAAVIMGLAISGMHYTGMRAASFTTHVPVDGARVDASLNQTNLALAVAGITFLILIFALIASLFDRQMAMAAKREALLRLTVDTIPTMVWAARSDGSAEFFNMRWLDYTGLTLDEVRDWGWAVAIHPEDLKSLTDIWRAIIASGEPGETEARLRRSDGAYRWFLFRAVPLRDEAGKIVKWYGTNTDIEDRRLTEQLTQQAERRLRAAIDIIPAIVWTTLPDGTNDFHNQRLQSYTRFSLEQAQGTGWTAMLHPDDVAQHIDTWRNSVETGNSFECESRLRRFDGEYRWFLARAEPLRDERGNILKWYGTNVDIDDRRRAEQALRRSEAYLAEAQRLSLTGSFGWRIESGEIFWSDETYRIFECSPTLKPTIELVRERIYPEDLALVEHAIQRASDYRLPIDIAHRLLMPDGTVKYVKVLAHAAADQSRGLEYIGALTDVTETKIAEEALHRAQAELAHAARVATLGEMAASIVHEVNQPITAIVTEGGACLHWLHREPPDLDEVHASVKSMVSEGHRAGQVVQRLRVLAKKSDPLKVVLEINDLIKEVLLMVERELMSHRVTARTELVNTLPPVLGDRVQLQQVIINLIMNGIDAMVSITDRPRELVIRSERHKKDQVIVAVQDSGIGISPMDMDRLFDAFFTTKPGGLGMGLRICRSIIEAHGGRLWASRNVGSGATLQFSLPLQQCRGIVQTATKQSDQ
jgi:PAS domain S-box-containing protein